MYKKLIYLISFVLVLGLVQASVAEGTDPNLVGWWKFDGNANDSSSQGNNGTTYGNPQWIAGYRDDALQFDGTDDYVSLPIGGVISTLSECTFATWVNWVGGADPNWQRIFDFGMTGNTGHYIYLCPKTGATSAAMRLALVTAYTSYWDEFDASTGALPTGWHHVAVTFSESDANTMTLYLDGNVVGSKTNCVNRISQLGNTNRNWLGRSVYTPDPYLNGTLDDFQIYNRVLSQPEIKKVANPEKASMPIPADGSIIGQLSVTLQWDAGVYAADVNGHEVYFGTNFTDVNTGTTPDFIVSDPCVVPGALEFDTEYFWRVDEVNLAEDPNVWRGDVWSFTVQPLTAYNPRPPDEAKYVDVNDDLVWDPGAKAKFHDVYLGTDETKVTDANRAIPLGVLVKQDHDANSYEPGTLQFSTTYYWRIDEVNATIWKGDVWSFETNPLILPPDPNLVGWWKFDDGEGTVAVDWSGNYNHATLYEPNWVTGYDGNALQFNGINDYVSLPVGEDINSLTSSTLATWVNFSGGGDWQNIFNFGTGTTNYIYLCPSTDAEVMYVGITTPETAEDAVSAPDALPSDWHHVAVTINADSNVMTLYLDAWPVGENIAATLTLSNLGVTTENWLGRSRWPNEPYFNGSMDDFRIYDYALTREEIALIMRVNPQLAWNPIPANGSTTDVVHAKRLSWSPGEMADKHDVYFGTDQTAVTDANRTNPLGILVSQNQDPNTYDPSNLEFGQTYYWRIDEVNMTEDPNIWKGKVWSFTTAADYIEIDNFNRYLTLDDLNDVWKDGYVKMDTGSHITVSTEIDSRYGHESPGPIHEGIDALQFVYDNNGFACRYVPDEWLARLLLF
ncbi:MAG: hypothetical protein AMJ43_08380 [Coxiella sp. DG_40]|nr:MAG: hypothetical protein AMJ43_08380 [Coxiella sp. DG_40]